MTILIFISAILLIFSKFLDCYSTQQGISSYRDEKNLVARRWMKRFGVRKVIWGIFGLTVLIVGISTMLVFLYYTSFWYQLSFVVVAIFVSIIQFAVARANKTKNSNVLTRLVTRMYARF